MAKMSRWRMSGARPRELGGVTRAAVVGMILAVAALMTLSRAPVAYVAATDAYAIKDAQIVTGTGRTIAKGTIVIRDGLITEVGETARIPADARVIDGTGLTVYPGLIDGYTNLGLPAPSQPAPTGPGGGGGRQAAAAGAAQQPDQALGDPSASAADLVRPGGSNIEDARTAGVTSALSSPRQGILAGQSALINLAGDEPSRLVVRAPVALTVQFTTASGFGGTFPGSLMGTVSFIRQTFYDAIRYRDEVERFNRVKRGVPRPEHNKKLAALQPVLKGELPVLFVANSDGDIRRALAIADEFKLKPIIAGALFSYRVTDLLKSRNVPVILSVDYPKRPSDMPEDDDEPLRVLRERAEAPKCAARLAQAGVKFAFTSGTLRPADFIANVKKAVENGLAKDEALRALTINAAEIYGVAEQLGTIETGKIANLLVTAGDLLGKDAKVRHVFIDGGEIELKKPETPAAGGRPGAPGGRPGPAVDPSGDWDLNVQSPQGAMTIRLSLRRDGDRIAGTLTGPMGPVEIRSGSMTGNQIRLTSTISMGGDSIEAITVGTIEGDTMRGTISIGSFGSFEFTGTRPR
ncbi:MAG TPA: amidohydrolase family protein [Blastocatellia bacterium]|nr:amidohydrolase family protein [Blastocatellia bacterium]